MQGFAARLGKQVAFERVAHGMAEVEELARTGLERVLGHDALFEGHGFADNGRPVIREPAQAAVLLKSSGIGNKPMFEHLGVAGFQLARVERLEKLRLDKHSGRGLKHAQLVFKTLKIDARFAAYAGIDLRQQRGRHLREPDTALI